MTEGYLVIQQVHYSGRLSDEVLAILADALNDLADADPLVTGPDVVASMPTGLVDVQMIVEVSGRAEASARAQAALRAAIQTVRDTAPEWDTAAAVTLTGPAGEPGRLRIPDRAARNMVAEPPCRICGTPSARVELVAPGEPPAQWNQWDADRRTAFEHHREPGRWHLLFEGTAAGNGRCGDPVDPARAARITAAFSQPCTYARVHTAGFFDDAGLCGECNAPYCYRHWHVSETGLGHCPNGHSKSLDPLW
jgi:hypothetical protein